MLSPIAESVWSATQPLRFWGVETGARMCVVRLRSGGLFVHSPLPLSAGLPAQVDGLGPIAAVVAPSLFHHLSVSEWKAAYPDAVFACCPGLQKKRSDVSWDRVLRDQPEAEWEHDLDQVFFGARTLENEVVFFHRVSKTMICADALFNLSAHPSRLTRVAAFCLGNHRPGATWLEHFMIRDRHAARDQIGRMLAWEPERILLAHGPCIDRDATEVLRRAYDWL